MSVVCRNFNRFDKKLLTLAYISNYGDKAKDGDACILS